MLERFNSYTVTRPRLKKIVGWFLVFVGFLALVTPLTPGGLLFFVGLEILGLRFIFTEKFKQFTQFFTPKKRVLISVPEEKVG